ncbi:5389_t:CDS:2, partial [Dentiscutata heterogama]
QNSRSVSDDDNPNLEQNSDAIGNSKDSSNVKQDLNSTPGNDASKQNSRSVSDDDNLNSEQNSDAIGNSKDSSNDKQDLNSTLCNDASKQNSRSVSDDDNPNSEQNSDANGNSKDSSNGMQDLNSTPGPGNDASKQNSRSVSDDDKPTSDNDNLNVKEDHDNISSTLSINTFNTAQNSKSIVKQDQGSTTVNGGSFQDTQNSTYNTKQSSRFTSNNDNFNTKEDQDSINSRFDNNISNTTLNSRSISDNSPTPNTKQILRFTNDNNDPYTKQDQASIITNNDSNNSFKHTHNLSSILDNDASNDKQVSDDLKVEKIKSIRSSKTISILVAVIAIIFGFAYYYEPVDSPIFRDLINTTNLLSGQLAELNTPASSVIMGYRVTSKNLADIINRNKLSSKNSDNVAHYLNQLGDKISNSGEAIEKMYSTGNHALKKLSSELRSIDDEISQEQVITRQDAIYFAERYGKILNTITKLRDEFRITLNELDDLYDLYIGMHHQLANGMKDVELFFDEVTPELEKIYNIGKLKRNLNYLKQIMKKVPDIRDRINNLLFEFNKQRRVLIEYREEWIRFRRRKLVSFEDTERLKEMIQKLTYVIKIFAKKDLENTEKRIYI